MRLYRALPLSKMEEDPTPIPSMGMRKSLIMNDEGVVTGEEVGEDLGHTDSGYVAVACFSVLVSSNTD